MANLDPNPYASSAYPAKLPPLVANVVIDDTSISIDYETELSDILASSLYFHETAIATRRGKQLVGWIFGAGAILLWVLGWFAGPDDRLFAWAVAGALSLLCAVWPAIYRWRVRRLVSNISREGSPLNLVGPRRMTLTREYVVVSSPVSQTTLRWIGVSQVVRRPDALYLTVSSFSALLVPRRAFASDAQFAQFAQAAQDYHAGASGRVV
jgi:hypothetical protein